MTIVVLAILVAYAVACTGMFTDLLNKWQGL